METKKMSGNTLMTDGVISFVGGLALLFLTGISQFWIVLAFAVYVAILGVTQMLAASGETQEGRGSGYLAFLGFFSLAASVGLLFYIDATLTTVLMLVGTYVVITGVVEAIVALAYRSDMDGYMWLVGIGAIRAIFGVFLLFNTGLALSTFVLYVAVYAIAEGIATSIFGYEVKESIGRYSRPLMQ